MKKIILLAITVIILASCTGGNSIRIPIKKGDIRTTETEDYIIVERCDGTNGFGHPWWYFESITKKEKENDTD